MTSFNHIHELHKSSDVFHELCKSGAHAGTLAMVHELKLLFYGCSMLQKRIVNSA